MFLSENRTGAAKLRLWAQLKQWSANGFLMGAGTVSRSASDRQLLDSGLVFGAVYTVYQVVEADGHCLIKLRNPPGDHGEWQGDWSDNSPLWTGRLRHKLGVVDDSDDGTFWMSVDDFVFAFRSLYLCRWFDPQRWFPETVTGEIARQGRCLSLAASWGAALRSLLARPAHALAPAAQQQARQSGAGRGPATVPRLRPRACDRAPPAAAGLRPCPACCRGERAWASPPLPPPPPPPPRPRHAHATSASLPAPLNPDLTSSQASGRAPRPPGSRRGTTPTAGWQTTRSSRWCWTAQRTLPSRSRRLCRE